MRGRRARSRPVVAGLGVLVAVVGFGLTQCDQAEPTDAPALDAPALDALAVKGKAPKTGYERTEKFGAAWKDTDHNGCNTRDDVLARDLDNVHRAGRCKVTSGTLHDPYTGRTIAFTRGLHTSQAVQIDHVVALQNAWQTGAQKLSQTERERLANDPENLRAVDGAANNNKRAGDAATWLPPNKGYRCEYVSAQIHVKAKYHLWITRAEKAALGRVLGTCKGT